VDGFLAAHRLGPVTRGGAEGPPPALARQAEPGASLLRVSLPTGLSRARRAAPGAIWPRLAGHVAGALTFSSLFV